MPSAIDIPIGLPESGPRPADVEARRRVGPRRNSVFPAPARAVLGATTYGEACARSRQVGGKAISKQLFNILGKIAEVDALVTPAAPGASRRDVPGVEPDRPRRGAHVASQVEGGRRGRADGGAGCGVRARGARRPPAPVAARGRRSTTCWTRSPARGRPAASLAGVPCASAVRSTPAAFAWRSWPESPQVGAGRHRSPCGEGERPEREMVAPWTAARGTASPGAEKPT